MAARFVFGLFVLLVFIGGVTWVMFGSHLTMTGILATGGRSPQP